METPENGNRSLSIETRPMMDRHHCLNGAPGKEAVSKGHGNGDCDQGHNSLRYSLRLVK